MLLGFGIFEVVLRQQTYSHLTESCNSKLLASYIKLAIQQFRPKRRLLILGSLTWTKDRGHTILVSCSGESGARDPFCLRNHDGWYICSNQELQEKWSLDRSSPTKAVTKVVLTWEDGKESGKSCFTVWPGRTKELLKVG